MRYIKPLSSEYVAPIREEFDALAAQAVVVGETHLGSEELAAGVAKRALGLSADMIATEKRRLADFTQQASVVRAKRLQRLGLADDVARQLSVSNEKSPSLPPYLYRVIGQTMLTERVPERTWSLRLDTASTGATYQKPVLSGNAQLEVIYGAADPSSNTWKEIPVQTIVVSDRRLDTYGTSLEMSPQLAQGFLMLAQNPFITQ
jgi:hypothetical protein